METTMAGNAEQAAWPLPKFQFAVSVDGVADDLLFHEVSGLDMEATATPYREGGTAAAAPRKLAELPKAAHITLRGGTVVHDSNFFGWFAQIKMGLVQPKDMTIRVLYPQGQQTMCLRIANAFPTKISGNDLGVSSEDVAVEELVIAHQGIERIS